MNYSEEPYRERKVKSSKRFPQTGRLQGNLAAKILLLMLKDSSKNFEWMALRDNEKVPANFMESYIQQTHKSLRSETRQI